jgi:hypothetical protein
MIRIHRTIVARFRSDEENIAVVLIVDHHAILKMHSSHYML